MIDIALNDAYIHAETPEEEQEVGILLNGALSGKTTCANGCIYPDQDGSTVGKGFILTLNENIGLRVSPVLDVDGTPGLELYCAACATQTVPDKAPYEMELGIEPVQDHYTLKDYIIVMYQYIKSLTNAELAWMGHDRKNGTIRLLQGLEMVDMLADYDEEAAEEEFWNFKDTNFPGLKLALEKQHRKPSRWDVR